MTLMTTSDKGLALIKKYEGCRMKAYKCPAGVWTIGYGHTRGVKAGMTITPAIADQLLIEDVKPCEKAINALGINLRQGQFDALVSFLFNVGTGQFNNSTLKRLILAGVDDEQIIEQFSRWIYAGGVVMPGLVIRREEEAALWLL